MKSRCSVFWVSNAGQKPMLLCGPLVFFMGVSRVLCVCLSVCASVCVLKRCWFSPVQELYKSPAILLFLVPSLHPWHLHWHMNVFVLSKCQHWLFLADMCQTLSGAKEKDCSQVTPTATIQASPWSKYFILPINPKNKLCKITYLT